MKKVIVKKKQVLQRTGDLNSKAYLVESGLLRSYTIDKNGKEHIFMFGPEGWIVSDFVNPDQPCDLYIDALEDAVVVQFEKDENFNFNPEKFVNRIRVLQRRVIMLMSNSAIERYDHFVSTYPNILQRVPQHMVASYLGITPESLSTVKRQLLKSGK